MSELEPLQTPPEVDAINNEMEEVAKIIGLYDEGFPVSSFKVDEETWKLAISRRAEPDGDHCTEIVLYDASSVKPSVYRISRQRGITHVFFSDDSERVGSIGVKVTPESWQDLSASSGMNAALPLLKALNSAIRETAR